MDEINWDDSGWDDIARAELTDYNKGYEEVQPWQNVSTTGDTTSGNMYGGSSSVDTGGISGLLSSLFGNGQGGWDLLKLGAMGGGLAGLLGGNKSSSTPTGYQGGIPKYTATRSMVTAPEAGRRPGAGGTRYGGDVTFMPKGSAGASNKNNTALPVTYDSTGMPLITMPTNQPSESMRVANPSQYSETYAEGGSIERYLQGGTDGMADEIPAQIGEDQPAALSHGEFVIPADVVSHLGNGNSDAGAQKLYEMMDKIREARTGTKEQGKEINPDSFMPGGLAKAYAAGGSVKKFNTGGLSGIGTAANAGVTGTESNLSNWVGPYVTDMLGKGQALSEMPYEQYMGPLTAGASGLQNKVIGGLQGANFPGNLGTSFSSAGAYQAPTMNMGAYQPQPIGTGTQPGLDQNAINADPQGFAEWQKGAAAQEAKYPGSTMLSQTPQGIAGLPQQPQQPQGIASQYMNPYLQSVLTPQLEELRRQNEITNMNANAKLTSAGAYGGGRQAIMNAENNRNLMAEMNKTVGQGYASAYDKAMNQFNTEQQQGMGLAKFMADQGAVERGIESEGIAADKAAFEEARANPYKMVQFQQSLLNGLPLASQNINTAQPSTFQNVLTGAGSVASLLNNLGLGPKKG
jgi:hypothetical protein